MLQSLPDQEEAKSILYQAVIQSLNQFENQNENQIENQFENAYVSVSVSDSVYGSLSVLGKSILNLLSKNITWKEFSNNYGGKREGSGRSKQVKVGQIDQAQVGGGQIVDKDTSKSKVSKFVKPTIDEIEQYCSERNNGVDACKFYDFYESKGWKVGNASMKDWKACVRTWESRNPKPVQKPDPVGLYVELSQKKREEQARMADLAQKSMQLMMKNAIKKFGGE